LNATTLSRAADGADLLYRQQFLCDKCGLPFSSGAPEYAASAHDDADILITEIIEQEIDAEDGDEPPPPSD
jgi:hypothetical protein